MTPAFASDAGIPGLVDALSTLLLAGQLSPAAKGVIVNYVTDPANFPYTTATFEQIRDRVRATAHLIVTSPEFTIQR
jgi:glutamate racemase